MVQIEEFRLKRTIALLRDVKEMLEHYGYDKQNTQMERLHIVELKREIQDLERMVNHLQSERKGDVTRRPAYSGCNSRDGVTRR